jgi:NADPH2:quinone reductase
LAAACLARTTQTRRDGLGSWCNRCSWETRDPNREALGRRTCGCRWTQRGVLETRPGLGADAIIALDQPDRELTAAFVLENSYKHFDIVLDYLWGHPTEVLLDALTGHDLKAESSGVRLVEIGEMAGPTISLSAAALRSSDLELHGSGGGSIPHTAIFDTFPQVWALAASGKLRIDTEPVRLADIGNAWERQHSPGRRIVIVP